MSFNYYRAIRPLLEALGWDGGDDKIFQAMPHLATEIDLKDLRNVLILLGYTSRVLMKKRLKTIDSETMPCVFESGADVWLITARDEQGFHVTDLATGEQKIVLPAMFKKGTACFFYKKPDGVAPTFSKTWFRFLLNRFRPFLPQLLTQSLLTNGFTLLIPLFIWGVYDFVVPSNSTETLVYLLIGIALGVFCSYVLSELKAVLVSYVGARMNMIISTEVMRQILSLPVPMVEGASVGSQIARIRQFDSVREIFTGPLSQLLLELPFFFVFIIIIAVVAGPIAIVPLILALAFVGCALYLYPLIRRTTTGMSRLTQERQAFLVETASQLSTIKDLNCESMWLQRFKNIASKLGIAQRDSERINNLTQNISQIVMKIAGAVSILWGVVRVMDGAMSMGALITLVMLVWRALAPLQAAFMLLGRFDLILSSITQINRLMALPTERSNPQLSRRPFQGTISLRNVSFRYPNETVPALQGVMMDALPGETIAIIGENGSGKSTIIKLLLGLYHSQAGSITLDGVDIRQYDPRQLRQSISYVPQYCHIFFGTLAQNLRLVRSEATDEDLVEACKVAGLWDDISALPLGLNTKVTDRFIIEFSAGFQQKLMLARAYLRDGSIMIFDEPGITLDYAGDQILKSAIQQFKGKKTIILVTHRPSLIQLADRVLALHNGLMRAFGPTDKVMQALSEGKA